MLLGIGRLMRKTGWCTFAWHLFFGLLKKSCKIDRNRILRTLCRSFQPWFIDLKTQQQNETKIWKPYDVAPVFKVDLLRFRLLCYSSPIFLTLGNLTVSFLARGSTIHRGRWTVVKGLLKRRGRRRWNVHLQCLNKRLFLKLPVGKHPPSFCYPRTAWPALRNSASFVERIGYMTSIWNTLKDDCRWSKWNEWIGNCILHILHYIVLHCLYISVVSQSKILSKDLWRNYTAIRSKTILALHFHQYLPYISENEDVVQPTRNHWTLASPWLLGALIIFQSSIIQLC